MCTYSPITPHHHEHGEKFLTFRYDHAGFNNIRMSFESVVVAAHAMGRTLIFPPNNDHKELLRGNIKESMEMGFEDLMSMKLLQTQRGFHSLTTEEFLRTQGLAGKLKGLTPSSLSLRGDALSEYLERYCTCALHMYRSLTHLLFQYSRLHSWPAVHH